MPRKPESPCRFVLVSATLLLLLLPGRSPSLLAQNIPAGSTPMPDLSHLEIYGGSGFLNPSNSVTGTYLNPPLGLGAIASATSFVSPHVGLEVEGADYPVLPTTCVYSAKAGAAFRFPLGRLSPFAHVLAGGVKMGGPDGHACAWGLGVSLGGGLDYILPGFNNRVALRLFQADAAFSDIFYAQPPQEQVNGFLVDVSAGIVFRIGEINPPPLPLMGCTVENATIFPGEPMIVTAHTLNTDLKRTIVFSWKSSGGKILGNGETASVETSGLAPGDYDITGTLQQLGKRSAEAHCTVGFKVRGFDKPTIACSVSPVSVPPGASATVTSVAISPQQRPLNYSYTTTAGAIRGNGAVAQLSTEGVANEPITISCNAMDDLGQNAVSTAVLQVLPAPVAGKTATIEPLPLCSVLFPKDKDRAATLDDVARKCLDSIATELNRSPTATLVIVGHHTADESPDTAALRALNSAEYLVHQRDVAVSRVKLLGSAATERSADSFLIPVGAVFLPGDRETIDSSSIEKGTNLYNKVQNPKY
jgi:hypothetical protein